MSATPLSALSKIVMPQTVQAEERDSPLITTLVVIDPGVAAYETLIAGVLPATATLVLNPQQDGIEQITQALQTHSDITSLHLISHGAPGCICLSNSLLNVETLDQYALQLKQWFRNRQSTPNPESAAKPKTKNQKSNPVSLLLYGCNVAFGDAGEKLLAKLHQLTGANIAAAKSLTGNAELGGNWDLAYRIGRFKPSLAFTSATLSAYPSVLANPTLLGKYDTSGYSRDVVIVGNYAYVADASSGLQILNISDPYSPSLVGSYDTPGDSWALQVVGNYAYVADGSGGLQIINISNPNSPTLIQAVSVNDARGVAVAGSYAYIASAWGTLQIFDISNPAAPIARGSASVTNQAWDVVVVGQYAYVTYGSGVQQVPASSKSGLQIFNISNPNNPTKVGEYKTLGNNSYNVAVVGNYAYIADGTSGLQIVNISNPANPTLVGSYDTEDFAHGIAVADNYAYVASGASLLYVVDVSNPANPTLVGSYDPPDNTYGVTVAGNYVYVSDGYKGVEVLTKLDGVIPPPNQAPSAANKTVTTLENTVYGFQSSDFSFADADGDSLQAVQITSLATAGYLFLDNNGNGSQDNGEALIANQQIAVANLGKLKFRPAQDVDGNAYASFGFKVSDGKAYSSSAYTITIDVTAVSNPSNPTPSNPTPSNPTSPSIPTPANPTPDSPIAEDQTGIPTAPINFPHGKQRRQGTNKADKLTGNSRSEWMRGKGGDDRLSGKGQRDLLEGGAGNDTLRGGSGDDILVGGPGNDRLLGGSGKDTYVYKSVKDGVDTILGFENSDLFDLRPIFGQAAFGGATPLARLQQFVRLEQAGANTRVSIDADGNGSNNTFITLATLVNVSSDTIHSNHFIIT